MQQSPADPGRHSHGGCPQPGRRSQPTESMTDSSDATLTGHAAPCEIVKNGSGRVVAEIHSDGDHFVLIKRSAPTFPPSPRHTLVGRYDSLQEARQIAQTLL